MGTGKVNITPTGKTKVPTPVPTGRQNRPIPVPTGRQNRPIPVPTGRGDSPSKNYYTDAEDEGIFDSGCSKSMTGDTERLDDFQEFQGGKVTFGGGEGIITGKWTIKTPILDFENVYYVKELQQFNLFSISQICDKKNRVLFTDTDCLVLSKDFMLPDERIKRDYSNARTPQQNGVAERKNRTLIEAARTMLADSKLPTMFWTEAVRTACYVLNRVLVTSPHNKTPYALLTGNIPSVNHFKPFGCHVSILNISDHLGKFNGKANEGYIVGYSASNRAYRVYNMPNKRVEETMNLRYLEEKPNVQGLGHEWYFDLDYLTDTLGYKRDKANQSAGTQVASTNPAGIQDADSDSECDEQVIIVPSYPSHNIQEAEPKDTSGDEVDDSPLDYAKENFQQELARLKGQEHRATSDAQNAKELQKKASTKTVPTGSPTDSLFDDEPTTRFPSPSDLGNNEPSPGIFSSSSYDDEFGTDLNNLASTVEV
ncbi:putative ribonuclease H-like domain-containing protein, partial [Tanacetum coccineum]